MDREEKIQEIRQRARKNFSLGYNCSECVMEAVLSLIDTGLPPEVKKLATGFGGGGRYSLQIPAVQSQVQLWR